MSRGASSASRPNHAVKLGVFVDEALDFLDSHGLPLEAVAVSAFCSASFVAQVEVFSVPVMPSV